MPKSRKRKGARRYKPNPTLKRVLNRETVKEALYALNAKSLVVGAKVREALASDDVKLLEATLVELKEASEEAHDLARTPLRGLVGPSKNKSKY